MDSTGNMFEEYFKAKEEYNIAAKSFADAEKAYKASKDKKVTIDFFGFNLDSLVLLAFIDSIVKRALYERKRRALIEHYNIFDSAFFREFENEELLKELGLDVKNEAPRKTI